MYSVDIYLTDKIDILTPAYDEWGVKTGTSTQPDVKARIEDTNQIVRDKNGQEVTAQALLLIDSSATVDYESKIKLKSRNGVDTQIPSKEFAIKKLARAHGFAASHWEVWL